MAADCGGGCGCSSQRPDRKGDAFWKALVWAFWLNLVLFFVEVAGALQSGSVSLLADAVDFLGDALNFGASLLVLGMASIWRSRLALAKGLVMGAWGLLVLGRTTWVAFHGTIPVHETMTAISLLALATNLFVAFLLYRHREGDANRLAVWLCARNDAFANLAVLVAAQGVAFTGRGWPDLVAALLLAGLGLWSGTAVVRQAWREIQTR
jgi:Co/Zn/Cd efflux system component